MFGILMVGLGVCIADIGPWAIGFPIGDVRVPYLEFRRRDLGSDQMSNNWLQVSCCTIQMGIFRNFQNVLMLGFRSSDLGLWVILRHLSFFVISDRQGNFVYNSGGATCTWLGDRFPDPRETLPREP